ncbi:MAG: hypothetical protein ACTSWC_12170 [Promethearchaeota archaeon]
MELPEEVFVCPYCGYRIKTGKNKDKNREKNREKEELIIRQKEENLRIKELEEKAKQLEMQNMMYQRVENPRIAELEEKTRQLEMQNLMYRRVKNPRIKELEEKIENTGNWAWICLCFFYPIGIVLFILRAQYKRELEDIRNNRFDPKQIEIRNLGWKAFGMWWLFAILGEFISMPIFMLMIGKYEDSSMATPVENTITMMTMMLCMVILPTLLAIWWYKRKKMNLISN